jgi:gamma-glutamylcyclotransferase (GGCT)/AIG2-like uncharacterized protein YtfP
MAPELFELFVNGTLMSGLALHANLQGATYLGTTATAPCYRLYSINDVHPGMYRLNDGEPGGISVSGELYIISHQHWLKVAAGEPPNLYRGRVLLQDGREVWGILYPRELAAINGHDISLYGDWRSYMGSKAVTA